MSNLPLKFPVLSAKPLGHAETSGEVRGSAADITPASSAAQAVSVPAWRLMGEPWSHLKVLTIGWLSTLGALWVGKNGEHQA